jgi:hypothetical protein
MMISPRISRFSLLVILSLFLPEGVWGSDAASLPSPLVFARMQDEDSTMVVPEAGDSLTVPAQEEGLLPVADSVTTEIDSTRAVPVNSLEGLFPAADSAETFGQIPETVLQRPIPIYRPVLFSALLPGAGQLSRGQKRGFAYIAAEAVTATAWAFFKNEGNNSRDEYVQFAREHARETAANYDQYWNPIQDRIQPWLKGDWEYYEHMSQYRRSGRYDRDLNTDYYVTSNIRDLDPETEWDDSFNYRQWGISKINFFQSDPDNPDALIGTSADTLAAKEYYAKIAVTEAYAWDWGPPEYGGTANRNQYGRIIDDANSAFRRASFSIGMLLANHVVSTIDAYISVKTYNSKIGGPEGLGLRMSPRADPEGKLGASISLARRF